MNFIDKLEKKFGHLGVPNLMLYLVGVNILSVFLNMVVPDLCSNYLTLDVYQIIHGQIWRLFTFIIAEPIYDIYGLSMASVFNLFWFAVWVYVYYFIGNTIENVWGSFRFTLFMLFGWLFAILAAFIAFFSVYSASGLYAYTAEQLSYYMGTMVTLRPLYNSLFLAFALLFPEMQFLVYFIVPVKAKWLAAVYLILDGYDVYQALQAGDYFTVALIVGAIINVTLFYVFARGNAGVRGAYRQRKRKSSFKKKVRSAAPKMGVIHRCAICQRTEQDAPDLEFRYCSKCEGSYEYCSDHLYTHEHVRK